MSPYDSPPHQVRVIPRVSSDQTENRTGDRRVSYIYEIKAASPEFLLRNSFRRTGFVRNGTVSVADAFSETLMRPNDSADSMSLHSPLSYTLHQDRSVSGGKLGFRMPLIRQARARISSFVSSLRYAASITLCPQL